MIDLNNIQNFKIFRENLHNFFPSRADALTELVDALSSNTTATSPVELSLNPDFRRKHHSVFDAIENFFKPEPPTADQESPKSAKDQRQEQDKSMTRLIATTLPPLQQRSYHLLGLDVTPHPRPFARTLEDRVFIHFPNPIAGNSPVTIGHACSAAAYLPERVNPNDPKWIVPLSARRVDSKSSETVVGAEQILSLVNDPQLPFHSHLTVEVADSKYSDRKHVSKTAKPKNLVCIVRCAGNRAFYQSLPPLPDGQTRPAHRPKVYGEKFSLQDPAAWPPPTQTAQKMGFTKSGKPLILTIECWDDMLMRGKDGIEMHKYPFRLVRVTATDEHGNLIFKRATWLLAFGTRRQELSLTDMVEAYSQRYDMEHFFRFGKQRLLLTATQTPNVEAEENWWRIVILAYVQLWLARELAIPIRRPWEPKIKAESGTVASPSMTQRDFGRLIQQFGTPADPPKPRGKSNGRQKGEKQTPRKRHPVIKKTKIEPKKSQKSTG